MSPQAAVDLAREALLVATLISLPVLAAGLVVGLAIGLLQALTQIQEQTVAFVPKLLAMTAALALALPWLINQMTTYAERLFAGIPNSLQ
jgi:flagellar biosynthetic protein FliQ